MLFTLSVSGFNVITDWCIYSLRPFNLYLPPHLQDLSLCTIGKCIKLSVIGRMNGCQLMCSEDSSTGLISPSLYRTRLAVHLSKTANVLRPYIKTGSTFQERSGYMSSCCEFCEP